MAGNHWKNLHLLNWFIYGLSSPNPEKEHVLVSRQVDMVLNFLFLIRMCCCSMHSLMCKAHKSLRFGETACRAIGKLKSLFQWVTNNLNGSCRAPVAHLSRQVPAWDLPDGSRDTRMSPISAWHGGAQEDPTEGWNAHTNRPGNLWQPGNPEHKWVSFYFFYLMWRKGEVNKTKQKEAKTARTDGLCVARTEISWSLRSNYIHLHRTWLRPHDFWKTLKMSWQRKGTH